MTTTTPTPSADQPATPAATTTPAAPATTRSGATAPTTTTTDDAAALTRLLRRLHFYAGILVGPFLLISALTGFFYALSPTAEQLIHHDLLTASTTAQGTALSEQVAAAEKALPDLHVNSIVVGAPGKNTMVLFTDKTLGESRNRAVFVDPGDAHVHGTSVVYGGSYALPERTWLSEMHRRLHLGEPGRVYSELGASWLAPLTLVGLWLWWRQRRATGAARELSTRGKSRKTHTTVGLAMALGFLFLSATGLTWSKWTGGNIGQMRTDMHWGTPAVSTSLSPDDGKGMAGMTDAQHAEHQARADGSKGPLDANTVDLVVATAHQQLHAPYLITPGAKGRAWTAKETRHSWTVGPNAVAVSPTTGDVTARMDFASFPFAAKLTDWGIRLHMGLMFGLVNQLVLAAIAAALVVVIVHGYRMWWLRRPTRRDGFAMGRPPRRGAMRRLFRAHPVQCSLVAAVVLVVGWFVPLLGTSLVGFLVVDSAIASARRSSGDASCC